MRLFLLAAAVLFALAAVVATWHVSLVISAVAWACWGLFAVTLDFLFGSYVALPAPRRRVVQQ